MSAIGYWGVPGTCRVTKVHIGVDAYKALCGQIFIEKFEFQWCAHTAEYTLKYVECAECKRRYAAALHRIARIPKRSLRALRILR
jgi:hypothetical protein